METGAAGAARSILAVEDDRFYREALGFILNAHGYPWAAAGDASEAREILADTDCAVAIVDIGLPGGENGLALAKWIVETKPRTRVLIVTSAKDSAVQREAYRSGIAGYLVKPVVPDELIDAVNDVIDAGGALTGAS